MPRTRAFYSVLQYVPDGGRAEAANAGVVLYVPETRAITVQVSEKLDRIRKFFSPGKQELRRIELAVNSAAHRLQKAQGEFASEEEFARFIAARADAVRMTPLRLTVVNDLGEKLGELYRELVGDDSHRLGRKANRIDLPTRLAETFGRLEAAGKAWRPGRITIPETGRKLSIPLAYKNGRVNFILPQSLAASEHPESRLPKLGFDGQLIHQHLIEGEASQLVVLSADPGAESKVEATYAKLLAEFSVTFVPFKKTEEFAAEVEKTAHE